MGRAGIEQYLYLLDEAHEDAVDPATVIPRHRAHERPDRDRHGHGEDPYRERDPAAVEDAGREISPERVGAEWMRERGPFVYLRERHPGRVVRRDQRRRCRERRQRTEHDDGRDRGPVCAEALVGHPPLAALDGLRGDGERDGDRAAGHQAYRIRGSR